MKLQELQAHLEDVALFSSPQLHLEQYATGPHIAARMLFTLCESYDDIEGRNVLDLGAGTGMLSIGAAVLGASYVLAVDIDEGALDLCQQNLADLDCSTVDLLHAPAAALKAFSRLSVDTVVTNPPFGTRQKGADVEFLNIALQVANRAVCSLHKSSTRAHLTKIAAKHPRVISAGVIAELRFDLPAAYAFHREKSKDIAVDLWRFEIKE